MADHGLARHRWCDRHDSRANRQLSRPGRQGLDCAIEATEKKRLGTRPSSPATTIVGKQNILCTYPSVAVLVGLGANALRPVVG